MDHERFTWPLRRRVMLAGLACTHFLAILSGCIATQVVACGASPGWLLVSAPWLPLSAWGIASILDAESSLRFVEGEVAALKRAAGEGE